MNKRIISVMIAALMVLALAACGSKKEPAKTTSEPASAAVSESSSETVSEVSTESSGEVSSESSSEAASESSSESSSEPSTEASSETVSESSVEKSEEVAIVGGWTLTEPEAVTLPEEVQASFDKIAVDDNKDLIPVALVAQQVVSGSNDMLLCKSGSEYRMIVIYRDLNDGAELTCSVPFDLANYTQGEGEANTEQLAGGWSVPEEITALPLPEDAQTAFDKAFEGFVGSNVEPMALLGTQVVSGTNYAVLCRVSPVVKDPVSTVQVVTIYADLQGNAEIKGFSPIDPADFNK